MQAAPRPRLERAKRLLAALSLSILSCGGPLSAVTALPPQVSRLPPDEVRLGKQLFFDARLSRNLNLSCASCHIPSRGFADGKVLSQGTHGNTLARHTPALFNLATNTRFFWDGRASSLEEQVLMPITSHSEMDIPIGEVCDRLNRESEYRAVAEQVYGDRLTSKTLARSLAAFVASVYAYNAPLDRYLAGDTSALSAAAVRGLELFVGKANCAACHQGPNLTDLEFHNTGVATEDVGRMGVDRLGKREFEPRLYPFFSMYKAFKTPGLRNIALTAPYMHNGSLPNLRDVVEFYNEGGRNPERVGRSPKILPLGLSEQEVHDLVIFLEALTSPPATEIEERRLPQ